jgi:serine/threonine protein kinase
LGEYQLLEKMGHGGMGTVYKARHVKLKRLAAIKLLPPERMEDTGAVARFEREMEAVGRLNHPNIVQAYDAREIGGTHFLAMEFVDGLNLHDVLQRTGPLSVADACEVIRQAAVGLQYAHEHGLVHRDMKPSNLMLTFGECSPVSPKPDLAGRGVTHPGARRPDGATPHPAGFGEPRLHSTVKILDLGLALLCGERHAGREMTAADQAMGTADYMAPEQIEDAHHVDIRADIYGLGCTLYKLLTGHAPFSGQKFEGGYRKMTAHLYEPVKPVSSQRNDIPEALDRVLDRMLAKAPADRYATPGELAEALRPFTTEADLGRLAVTLRNADPARAVAEASRAATDDYRSSGYVDTEAKRRRAHGVVRPVRKRIDRRLVATAVFFVGLIALGIIFTLRDGPQTVKVEIDGALLNDASVTVWLDGKEMEVKGVGETIKLKPGAHGYQIRRGDQIITTREFTVAKGDNPVLKISVEGTPGAAKPERTRAATASLGAVNYELTFDGVSSYVRTPVKYDGSHPLTLEAWVTIGQVRTDRQYAVFSNLDDAHGIVMSLQMKPEPTWVFEIRRSENEHMYCIPKSRASSERHHVAIVLAANQASFFVDGLPDARSTFSEKDKFQPSTQPFTIGAVETPKSGCWNFFSGNIDEVRISRSARYHEDFAPQPRFESDDQTLAIYHFDEGEGDIAHDASGNGNHAKIVGAEWAEEGYRKAAPAGLVARPARIPGLGRWQVATRYPTSEVNSVAWSPDGMLIACGDKAGWLRIHDARMLALVRLLPGHQEEVTSVAWSPDGSWLASSGKDGIVRLWKADGAPGPVLRYPYAGQTCVVGVLTANDLPPAVMGRSPAYGPWMERRAPS